MKEFKKGNAPIAPPPSPDSPAPSSHPQAHPGAAGPAYRPTGPATPLEYETLDLEASHQEKFAVAVYGAAGSGKTRLMTTAPGTVGIVPLNRKTRQTVIETAKAFDKRIILPKFDLLRSTNPMRTASLKPNCEQRISIDIYREQPMCCAIHNGRWAVDRTKQAALDMVAQCDSIGIDGFDIFTEDMLTAHYGRTERIMPKDRGSVNKEMIEFIGSLSTRHLVLTMAQKEVWRNDKPTGEFDWSGWKHIDFHTNCIIHAKVRNDYNEDKHPWRWAIDVILSQANPALMGLAGEDLLVDDAVTFPQLALRTYPESEYEDWL